MHSAKNAWFTPADELRKSDFPSPVRLLAITAISIFLAEALVMIFITLFQPFPALMTMILDSLLLVALILPALYLTLVRPMVRHISAGICTEQELRKTNQLLERLFSVSDFWIAYLDTHFHFIRVDQPFAEAGGHSPEFYIGKNHFALFPDAENEAIFRKVLETGEPYFANDKPNPYQDHIHSQHPEGEGTHWNWYVLPTRAEDQTITGLVLILIDITEQKIAEKALQHANILLEKTFSSLGEAVLLIDPRTRTIITGNPAVERIFGYSTADIVGRNTEFLHVDRTGYEEFGQKLFPALDQQGVFHIDFRMRRKDGSVFYTENTATEIRDDAGRRTAVVSVIRDITKRRVAQEEITQRNRELAALNAISERFSSTLSMPKLWGDIKHWLSAELEIPGGMIFSAGDEMTQFHLVAAWGFPESVSISFQTIPCVGFHNPTVVEKGEAVLVPDLRQLEPFLAAGLDISRPNWRNYLCIPLITNEKILGILDLFTTESSPFSAAQENLFRVIGHGIGMAINNSQLYEAELSARQRMQSLSHRLVEVQEKERWNIARELHDEAGQAVTSLKYDLQLLEQEASQPERIGPRLVKLHRTVEMIMDNLHHLAMDLRPASLDRLGLVAALTQYIQAFDESNLSIHFKAIGMEDERLPQEVEINLYRIVQEALTNVIRHARASNVDVLLERRDGKVILVVEDNGMGFEPNSAPSAKHLGLVSMQERAEMLGGTLEVESFLERGTTLVVEVPYGNPDTAG